ncbi:MAG TPA: hypothetical protein DCE62_09155, partial [Glaciecola sp.]|nr:hypothetical protein [Glaciecola sp.]
MTLLDILITVMIIALAASFWRVRDYAELARNSALQYCSKHQLVFVSVARRQIHWQESPEQRRFQFDYTMEFSTANDVVYEGGRTDPRQDRADCRGQRCPADGDEGAAAGLFQGHAG